MLSIANALLTKVARTDSIPSIAWDKASNAVLMVIDIGRLFVYLASRNAIFGNSNGDDILVFVCLASLVNMEYGVTSEPVPAVVGTKISGNTCVPYCQENSSSSFNCCTASRAIALAASIGEPPPIPIINSAFRSLANAAPSYTLDMEGLLWIRL